MAKKRGPITRAILAYFRWADRMQDNYAPFNARMIGRTLVATS